MQVNRKIWFDSVSLLLLDGSRLEVAGLKRAAAASLVDTANDAWRRYIAAQFGDGNEEIDVLAEAVDRLKQPRRYPSACLLEPFVERANALAVRLPKIDPVHYLSSAQQKKLNTILSFQSASDQLRNRAIKTFIDTELFELKDFFDEIESNPLTPEQRHAVLTDEDATLVLAGAGSGKTSVIVAKAAYLIRRAIRQPKEILLLAFGNDAAKEMATRIEERCGSSVDALTFHALGYGIIRQVEGQAPALAAHASDDVQFRALMRDLLLDAANSGLGGVLLRWFSEFYHSHKTEWDFETKHEYYQYIQSHDYRTLAGEAVKSFEELMIANWLFENGIAYEYEPVYEHDLPANDRRVYQPDFRLKESGVYIEHFGVRIEKLAEGTFRLYTAPYIDRERYLEDRAWKRKVHREHRTTLIETFSFENFENYLLDSLREKVAPYAKLNPISPERIFGLLNELGQVDGFTQTLGTFLRHFKSAGLTVALCRQRAEKSKDASRNLAFLKIFEPVMAAYQERLGDRIDFEDMIVRATNHVREGRYRSPYRHLLVDEFQDMSDGRAQLLLALKAQHADARVFAVGDDWQSIYRFAGSDIHLMRYFGSVFGGKFAGKSGVHSAVDLGRTFRSVDKIALPARHFILQNPSQIEKRIVPASTASAPAIKVVYYSRGEEDASLRIALENVKRAATADQPPSVFLLGRYHFVRPNDLDRICASYPSLSIRYMTAHAAKGLEADHVIILRAASGRMGFPSEIVDDLVLNMALPEPEVFEHAEERRLFYVAVTRARRSVTLLADREEPSVFVEELVEDEAYMVAELNDSGAANHRCSACGGRMLSQTSGTGRLYFACEHQSLCGNTLPSCKACNKDFPVRDDAEPDALACSCGARFHACPECDGGWLVERKGRYGEFLGCVNYPTCKGSKPTTRRC